MFTSNPPSFFNGARLTALLLLAMIPAAGTCRAQAMTREGISTSSSSAAGVPANYLLSPNDLVEVKVFQEEDMDWTVRVTQDGTVNLPVVGAVSVLHKTPAELGEIVKARLHDGYLVHPQVSIAVLEFSKRRFTILGEINKPGQIDFPDNSELDLLQAIGMAGGFTKDANPARIYVKRQVGNREVVLTVDAKRMARRNAAPFKILPGDAVTVSETIF